MARANVPSNPNPPPAPPPSDPPQRTTSAPPTVTPPPSMPTGADLARRLQLELQRVGCFAGTPDGRWDDGSREALEFFNRHANTRLDANAATDSALEAVRVKRGIVCIGEGDSRKKEGRRPGRRSEQDEPPAKKKAEQPAPKKKATTREVKQPKRKSTAQSNCFTANGRQFCQ
jgi:hypothetical protein